MVLDSERTKDSDMAGCPTGYQDGILFHESGLDASQYSNQDALEYFSSRVLGWDGMLSHPIL